MMNIFDWIRRAFRSTVRRAEDGKCANHLPKYPLDCPVAPAVTPGGGSSPAYERFMQSTKIGYIEWHDGIGYDMDAFRAMTADERDEVVRQLSLHSSPPFDWRDIEVFEAAGTTNAVAALRSALQSSSADSRLHAAVALHVMGQLDDLRAIVVRELDNVTIIDGMVFALGLLGSELTPQTRDALLHGALHRPEVGPHYAAKLCQLAGKTSSDFDWGLQPLFLRFGEHASSDDRTRAYRELCEMIGLPPDSSTASPT